MLTCFHNSWNRGIWRFHFLVVYEDHVFGDRRLGDGILGISAAALPPTFTPCPLEVEIGESPDDQCIHGAMVTACMFSWRAQTTPNLHVSLPRISVTIHSGRAPGPGRGTKSRRPPTPRKEFSWEVQLMRFRYLRGGGVT